MRILVIAALYPPEFLGGAEISAANLSRWLASQGHEVTVLATARSREEECRDLPVDGVRLWRLRTAHLYPMFDFPTAPAWKKPIWHLQDHIDPRNSALMKMVLDAVRPDFVNIHILQGIGHNALRMVAARGIPTLYVLHDLGLACIRMAMQRSGRNCQTHCRICRISSEIKRKDLSRFERLGLVSPSAANLETLRRLLPLDGIPTAVIPNANRYPTPTRPRSVSPVLRLLYVGRLHPAKGVAVLLEAAERITDSHRFRLDIVGDGPQAAELRGRFGHHDWVNFQGAVSEQAVGDQMQDADLLCVPSTWQENWPGVVVRALGVGLPVLASDIGGLPELVRPGLNGELLPPGDVGAWARALGEPGRLATWRRNIEAEPPAYDQDELGHRMLAFMATIAGGALPESPPWLPPPERPIDPSHSAPPD
jgi:glycosyltransferase involved in cell wall biosynthesis